MILIVTLIKPVIWQKCHKLHLHVVMDKGAVSLRFYELIGTISLLKPILLVSLWLKEKGACV